VKWNAADGLKEVVATHKARGGAVTGKRDVGGKVGRRCRSRRLAFAHRLSRAADRAGALLTPLCARADPSPPASASASRLPQMQEIPSQDNFHDCALYTLTYTEFLSFATPVHTHVGTGDCGDACVTPWSPPEQPLFPHVLRRRCAARGVAAGKAACAVCTQHSTRSAQHARTTRAVASPPADSHLSTAKSRLGRGEMRVGGADRRGRSASPRPLNPCPAGFAPKTAL